MISVQYGQTRLWQFVDRSSDVDGSSVVKVLLDSSVKMCRLSVICVPLAPSLNCFVFMNQYSFFKVTAHANFSSNVSLYPYLKQHRGLS